MNLQEQIDRMREMMGLNESNVPLAVRRRLNEIKKLLDVVLNNSYPCDFDNSNDFINGVIYDVRESLEEISGMSSGEIASLIYEYFTNEIEEYYNERTQNC
jgi:hypothetical protein